MPGSQTELGKAYEFACLCAIASALQDDQSVVTEENAPYHTALNAYVGLSDDEQRRLLYAANAAARVIVRLEPQLTHAGVNTPLYLSLQADAQGIAGDVRDVLCIRRQNGWQIGLSCKHNHHAVKHSRLSATIDFGAEWFGYGCSQQYFEEVVPLFEELRRMRDEARANHARACWNELPDKAERYYLPVLRSFMDELNRLATAHDDVPTALVRYLIGRHDFNKVITDDSRRTTRVEAINLGGTLNRPAEDCHSIVDVPTLRLPTCFYHVGMKPNSDNTVIVVCDEGWTISMRIHSASTEIEPSLKFDVNLISLPGSIHAQVEPW